MIEHTSDSGYMFLSCKIHIDTAISFSYPSVNNVCNKKNDIEQNLTEI